MSEVMEKPALHQRALDSAKKGGAVAVREVTPWGRILGRALFRQGVTVALSMGVGSAVGAATNGAHVVRPERSFFGLGPEVGGVTYGEAAGGVVLAAGTMATAMDLVSETCEQLSHTGARIVETVSERWAEYRLKRAELAEAEGEAASAELTPEQAEALLSQIETLKGEVADAEASAVEGDEALQSIAKSDEELEAMRAKADASAQKLAESKKKDREGRKPNAGFDPKKVEQSLGKIG